MASSTSESSSDDDGDVPCAECGALYGSDEKLWIKCDECKSWMHTECVDLAPDAIPDLFMCENCS